MNYKEICTRVMNVLPDISDVLLIDMQSRLLAYTVRDGKEATLIDEGVFAERLEDLAFIVSACKHYERSFEELEYIQISYKRRNSVLFPLGYDMILVICMGKEKIDAQYLAVKVSEAIHETTQIIKD